MQKYLFAIFLLPFKDVYNFFVIYAPNKCKIAARSKRDD
jgi:hypothetical protein